MALPFLTVGHSTRTVSEFVRLLEAGGVQTVVDIRTIPRSRTNPQFNGDALPGSLEPFGIRYEYFAELGGLRGKIPDVPESVNAFWRNRSFHNYADYAMGGTFEKGLGALISLGRERRAAVMCSEAVWWRCHRRIVADYLLHHGETVFHLMGEDRMDVASMTPAARAGGADILVYPAETVFEGGKQ